MLISPQLARDTLTDLTKDCGLPLDAGELIPGKGEFLDHDHVFIGDVAVRGYKDKGRWKYDDRDIRRAGQALAAVAIDATDAVDAQVPSRRYFEDRGSFDDCNRADWRRTLNHWIYAAAQRARWHEIAAAAPIATSHTDNFDLFDPETTDVFDTDVWSSRYEIGPTAFPASSPSKTSSRSTASTPSPAPARSAY